MQKDHRQLAVAIETLLTDGIRLSADVLHYLDTAMGIRTPEALEQVVAAPDDCEAESLCELVFFPDEVQQVRLEPLLEGADFTKDDIDKLADDLARAGTEAVLIFPDDTGTVRLPVSEAALRQFISRLKIDRKIDGRLAKAIDQGFAETEARLFLRVALRNARFVFSDKAVGFMNVFLSHIAPETPDFMELFVFCCDTLERIGLNEDIYDALMARKRHNLEMIRQVRKSEQQLKQQPVEALMMKGISISCIGVDEARRQIGWIDRISMAIYGKTEVLDRMLTAEDEQPFDLGVFEKCAGDIDKVIKILS